MSWVSFGESGAGGYCGQLRSFSSLRLDALADGPDKARELARERDHDLVVVEVPGVHTPVLGAQAQLRPPGDVADGFRYSCLSGGDDACDPRRIAIGPGRLDQRAPRVAVARLGDRALVPVLPGGVLARHQAQVTHELARRGKAGEIAQFRDERHRMHELDTAHRLQ